ncbi:MAG: gliding motility-associated C-terminal domain-containing protein [Chitinophagaceae bacterium]|nr:gliding motility-associated C-terminal domain-containing protein [Chitinophagaceae bacterium]MCB9055034.1 gliding motility-associated C-terminal domain-containing protein [Chitinophagales bacterium]
MCINPFFKTSQLLVFAFNLLISNANAQETACPPNLDFEYGDFTNWQCQRGNVVMGDITSIPNLHPATPGIVHKIIPATDRELDIFGGFPKNCPNGSGYSIKLGNSEVGAQAESLSYTYTIPQSITRFSITYYYAVVLQNPGHLKGEQPRFRARVIDMEANREIDCVSFDFTASSSLPGFKESTHLMDILYKDWTPVTIDLSDYAGKTIKLEFITSDCTRNGHFGYAYVDVNSNCSNSFAAASLCQGDDFLTLTSPYGYASYEWYSNYDYSHPIADTQTFYIDPAPPVSTTYSVIVTPYPGYGCVDTLYAPMVRAPKPGALAGSDREVWCNETIQLGEPHIDNYAYLWTPADNLTNPNTANPFLKNYIYTPKRFTLNVTDNETGCVSTDSVLITPINCFLFVPKGFTPNGDGLNDVLRPYMGGIQGFRRFSVFNRYGNLVFSTSTEGVGWDGTYKGIKSDTGVYVWMLEFISKDNKPTIERGTVVLIR